MSKGFEQPPREERDFSKLVLSNHEYVEKHRRSPFRLSFEHDGRRLEYFAAKHSNDPENPQFKEIETMIGDLQPDLVVVEGMAGIEARQKELAALFSEHPPTAPDIIARYGESGFVLMLALKNGIDFRSPEPSLKSEIDCLEKKKFSREDIVRFYLRRQAGQYVRRKYKSGLREYIKPELEQIDEAVGWKGFERLLDEVSAEDPASFAVATDPMPWPDRADAWGVTNEITAASSRFRDEYMVKQLAELSQTYKNIAVVYGSGHAITQEPALRALYNQS